MRLKERMEALDLRNPRARTSMRQLGQITARAQHPVAPESLSDGRDSRSPRRQGHFYYNSLHQLGR